MNIMAATIYSKIQNPDLNINCFNKSSNEVSTLSFVIFFFTVLSGFKHYFVT